MLYGAGVIVMGSMAGLTEDISDSDNILILVGRGGVPDC